MSLTIGEISAGLAVGTFGVKVATALRGYFGRRRSEDALAREAKELLGIREGNMFAYRAAALHPLYERGLPHPDDRAALVSMGGDDVRRGIRNSQLEVVDTVTFGLSDGMVLVGSPEAEGVTRLAFGYSQRKDGLGMEYNRAPIELPYRWEEDQSRVTATCQRFVAGKGQVARPNWPLVDQRGAEERLLFPEVGNDGLLETDLLLITKVPNYLTTVGYQSGRSIISVAGTHGTATRAIDLVLKDRGVLAEIRERIPYGAKAFQVVIEAGKIYHDSAVGSVAKAVRVLDACTFGGGEPTWDAANRMVTANMNAWRMEVEA